VKPYSLYGIAVSAMPISTAPRGRRERCCHSRLHPLEDVLDEAEEKGIGFVAAVLLFL
jgi:hypothetical protein